MNLRGLSGLDNYRAKEREKEQLVRNIESKFDKMMLGQNYTDDAGYLTMPFLRKSYGYACHLKLDQITALKYVCTQLQTVIDERLNKEFQEQSKR